MHMLLRDDNLPAWLEGALPLREGKDAAKSAP